MLRDAARAAIQEILAEVKQYLAQENPPKLSEADTKANFIEPILAALGWSGIGVVVREYYVKNSQEFIDYVMKDAGTARLAIEAKPLQADLTDKASAQLVQYCVVEGVEWAALTNGRELRFFNTYLKGDLTAKLALRLDLLAFNSDAEYEELFENIWLLSREGVTTPTGASTWLEQKRMDQALRALLFSPSSAIVKALRRQLYDADVKVGPEAIVAWFRARLSTNITVLPSAGAKPHQNTPLTTAAGSDAEPIEVPLERAVNDGPMQMPEPQEAPAATGMVYRTASEKLAQATAPQRERFEALKSYLLSLGDDVEMKTLKTYFAFWRMRSFASVEIRPQPQTILIYVQLDPKRVELIPGFTRDVSGIGHSGPANLEVTLRSDADLERVKPLLQRSYETN